MGQQVAMAPELISTNKMFLFLSLDHGRQGIHIR